LTHETIQNRGWVEAYVQRRLTAEETAAFEEHYFACDQCFAEMEELKKFIAGVRQAGRRGLLDAQPAPRRWAMPAFAFASITALMLAAGLFFMAFIRMPEREAELQKALADARANAARSFAQLAALNLTPRVNVPVVILTAERAPDSRRQLNIESATGAALFWIDVPPAPPGTKFDLTIETASHNAASPDARYSKSIRGLERNQDGALAFSLPVNDLASGPYVVRLNQPPGRMVAEYRVDVLRK
jgi:hypothetical protein